MLLWVYGLRRVFVLVDIRRSVSASLKTLLLSRLLVRSLEGSIVPTTDLPRSVQLIAVVLDARVVLFLLRDHVMDPETIWVVPYCAVEGP